MPRREIVLLGAGHTHLHVLRLWRDARIAGARLTCISDFFASAYSGMLPGTLAGLYPTDRMYIDLTSLCNAGGVRLVRANVQGLDLARRELICEQGPPIPFDILSIGIGSVPKVQGIEMDDSVLPIKPMQSLLPRLDTRLRQLVQQVGHRPLRLAVVGGGAGGVEIAMCLPVRLRRLLDSQPFELCMITGADRLLNTMPRSASRAALHELRRRGVTVLSGKQVLRVQGGVLTLDDTSTLPCDLALWCTGPQPPPLLGQLGLPTDERGFLLTRATLQSVGDPNIFVVGDSGTIAGRAAPKAGVYAVREGPILWGNLHRTLFSRPLLEYAPQRQFLALLASGDGRAILSYYGVTIHAQWCWRLKNAIDTRFVQQFGS